MGKPNLFVSALAVAMLAFGANAASIADSLPRSEIVRGHEDTEWSTAYGYNMVNGGRPRVLLIGDSITCEYAPGVRRLLAGKVDVSYWASSYCVTSPGYLKLLEHQLDETKFDIVHFNNGLHSTGKNLTAYAKRIAAAIRLIHAKQPAAKVIWVSSTPLKDAKKNETVIALNKAARPAALEAGVAAVNDLYSLADPLDRETHWTDCYHHKSTLVEMFAARVAKIILAVGDTRPMTVVPMGIGMDAKTDVVAGTILVIHARSGIDRFVLHAPGHGVRISGYFDENGYRDVGRRVKAIQDAVATKGIKVGFLMGPTMNVGINHPWTKFVKKDGTERPFTACPGDPAFRKAFAAHCAAVAAECRPFLYMMEDDFRLFWGTGCYCERHKANPTQALEDLVSLAGEAAKAIHFASPETRIGLSAPGGYRQEAVRIAKALADGGRPFIRWYGTEYGFDVPMRLPDSLWPALWMKQNISEGLECVYEADACPNTAFYGSGTRLVSACSTMLANGYDGLWYWIGNNDPTGKFGEIPQPNLEAYARAKEDLAAVGACGREGSPVGIVARSAAGGRLMARYGFPYRTAGDGVEMYCGRDAFAGLARKEVEKILSGRVLLDGDAALALTEMGCSELTGVKASVREGAVDFSEERITADGSSITSTFHQNYGLDGTPVQRLELAGAEEVSRYCGGADHRRVQSALTRHVNKLGGKVAVLAVSLEDCTAINMLNYRKRLLVLEALEWLGGKGVLPVRTDSDVNVMLFANEDAAKTRLFVHVTELSCDPRTALTLVVEPPYRGGRVEVLENGQWRTLAADWKDDRIVIPHEQHLYGTLSVKIHRLK